MESKTYTYEEVLAASCEYFGGDDLAAKAFVDKYALRNKEGNFIERTPDDMHHRMARELARIEKKKYTGTAMEPLTEKEIYELFKEFKYIVPQGSVMSGLGDNVNYTSLSNCFVVNSPEDSYAGICKTDEELVQISKRRGGTGCSLDNLRPSGTPTTNSAKTSTGVVTFMERYSNTIREVGQNSRRGALLITLSVHHPDVLAFINAKKDLSKVTGANISVQLSDEFMNAVQADVDYEQRWPINSKHPKIIKKVRAKDIWNQIVANAHATAEPGVFFWDTVLKESPADCYSAFGFKTITANPCGEVPLSILDSCRLLALNLVSYVKNPYSDSASFDWDLFKNYVNIAQRLMDDIVDAECERVDRIIKKIHSDPENESLKERELSLWKNVREVCETGRRTGTGTTAVGDMIAALGLKYDSNEAILHIDNVFRTLKLACYRSSVDMAKAIGPFKYYAAKLEEHNPFIKRIAVEDPELYADMKKHGRRNIAMLTNAPTGTVSLMTQTTSGVEPLFMMSYTRRKKINDGDRSVKVDFVDPKGDKWQEFEVFHPQIEKWKIAAMSNDITKSPWYGACAEDIAWDKRVKLQAACQKHIDHAISSCLVGDSYIFTNYGIVPLHTLTENIPVKKFGTLSKKYSSVNIDGESAEITAGYNNGKATIRKISFAGDWSISGTLNHKIVVLDKNYALKWKEIKDVLVGDYVVGRTGLNLWNRENIQISAIMQGSFTYDRKNGSKTNIKIPRRTSPDLARLLGYLCSDGHVSVNGIGLTQQKNNILDDFTKIVKKLFNVQVVDSLDPRSKNLHQLNSNSREIAAFFTWLGVTAHDKIRVPKIIMSGGQKAAIEFIKGATLDGYVTSENLAVATSISYKYLKDIQMLLINLGINSNLSKSSDATIRVFPSGKAYATKKAWVLHICDQVEITKFINIIGFAEDRKNKELKNKYRRPSRINISGKLPNFGLREFLKTSIMPRLRSNFLYVHFGSFCRTARNKMDLSRESILEMKDLGMKIPDILVDPSYIFRKVIKISSKVNVQTYDLSVPKKNSYIANGLISHNTVNVPENTTVDTIQKIYMTAWELGCKGITVYRKNSRTGVLVEKKQTLETIKKNHAPKRPKELPCDVHHVHIKGTDYYVLVGLLHDDPYEVFAGKETSKIEDCSEGTLTKLARGAYKLTSNNKTIIEDVTHKLHSDEEALTRMTSTALRHGADIAFVVHQLEKTEGDMMSFAKSIARALKKYLKDGVKVSGETCLSCGNTELHRQEGCVTCKNCGWSKCV